ncbi:MAG: hypothetical protein RLZZ330_933 [Actinomycetota bacterium]
MRTTSKTAPKPQTVKTVFGKSTRFVNLGMIQITGPALGYDCNALLTCNLLKSLDLTDSTDQAIFLTTGTLLATPALEMLDL